jgi:hypothetical protein
VAKRRAPVSLSGGTGFNFEDCVAGRFLVDMLGGIASFGHEFGHVVRLDWQVRDTGRLLDDVAVTLDALNGSHTAEFSIKSHRQVTGGGFPSNFVEAAWEEWFHTESSTFQRDRDLLVMCTGKIGNDVIEAWEALLSESLATTPDRMANRLAENTDPNGGSQSSEIERDLFSSLHCPDDLKSHGPSDATATVAVSRRVRLLEFDFESNPSRDHGRVIVDCQALLRSGDPGEAKTLWESIVEIAAKNRGSGGSTDLPRLLAELRPSFSLIDHPDYRADWRALERATRDVLDDVRTDIGGVMSLDRQPEIQKIRDALANSSLCLAAGESGCGKSALAKVLSERSNGSAVALSPDVLESGSQLQFDRILGISHPLIEVLAASRQPCLLVLDSLERFSGPGLRLTARIIAELVATVRCQHVRILLVTQFDAAKRVVDRLVEGGVVREKLEIVPIDLPSEDAVQLLLRGTPSVPWATLHQDMRPLLRNLKILDWVVRASSSGSGFSGAQVTGLISLIDYLWERWMEADGGGIAQGGLLKKLATLEASTLASGVPATRLEHAEQQSLPALIQADLLRRRNERILFSHDLLGDWARLKVLEGEDPTVSTSGLLRGASPRWHRAVRLFGRWLLSRADGASRWADALRRADSGTDEGTVVCDLLLEAVVVSENAYALMALVWPVLVAEDAKYLKRLLDRFLFVATIPDLGLPDLAHRHAITPHMEAAFRVPLWPYWGALLRTLDEHVDEIASLAPIEAARICRMWLEFAPVDNPSTRPFPWRLHSARIALKLARELRAQRAEGTHIGSEQECIAYEAALLAAHEFPDEVTEFALEMAERRPPSPEIQRRAEAARVAAEEAKARREAEDPERAEMVRRLGQSPLSGLGPLSDPWPDGPQDHVATAFSKAVFDGSALIELAKARPEAALEILLAVCIEPPAHQDPFGGSDMGEDCGVESWREFDPPLYFRGPFLEFIRTCPTHGVDFVIRLVNFASARWREHESRVRSRRQFPLPPFLEEDEKLEVCIGVGDQARNWIGDRRVFRWHLDSLRETTTISCALMALEKWLDEQLNSGADIEAWLEQLMARSESVALAGLLIDIGKRERRYFRTSLRALLGVSAFYLWEPRILVERSAGSLWQMSWWRQPQEFIKMAREWHTAEYRRRPLPEIAASLMLSSPVMESFFANCRERWRQELNEQGEPRALQVLIELLARANYSETSIDGARVQVKFVPPEAMAQQVALESSEAGASMLLITFPIDCLQIIDGKKLLPATDLETFWDTLQGIAMPKLSDSNGRSRQANAIFGGIAVLLKFHREWLTAVPQRMSWCLEQLWQTAHHPPTGRDFDVPESAGDWEWDCFAGQAAVYLLEDSVDDRALRLLVALGVVAHHYSATRRTMLAAHELRESLGTIFESMKLLAVRWSMIRRLIDQSNHYAAEVARFGQPDAIAAIELPSDAPRLSPVLQQLRAEVERWADEGDALIEQFVDGTIAPISVAEANAIASQESERLEGIRFPGRAARASRDQRESSYRSRRNIRRMSIALDKKLIQSAFAWMELPAVTTEAERQKILGLVRELLALILDSLQLPADALEEDDDEIDGLPDEFDAWVFGHVASAIVVMRDDEQPSSMWRPILQLGSHAHEWTEHFFWAWFTDGVRVAPSQSIFAERWAEMIRFAIASPSWDPNENSSHDLDDAVFELLGCHRGLDCVARDDRFAPIMERMLPVFAAAAERWFLLPRVANGFARCLREPAYGRLLCPGILWLYRAVKETDEYSFWREHEIESNLISVLHRCWEQCRAT